MKDNQKTIQARADSAERHMREQEEAHWVAEGLYLTDAEKAEARAVWDKYSALIQAAADELDRASATRPDVSAFYQGLSPDRNPEEWKDAQQRAKNAIRAWEASAPQEWKDAQNRLIAIHESRDKSINAIARAAYQRQYMELPSEPGQIVQQAKEQAKRLITDQHSHYTAVSAKVYSMSARDMVALGGKEWKLDAAETRKRILESMRIFHFRALGNNTQAIDEIKAYIEQAIAASPYIAPEGTPGTHETIVFRERPGSLDEAAATIDLPVLTPDFIYGGFAVMPISRVIQEQRNLANGKKTKGKLNAVWVGGEGEERAEVFVKITTEKDITPEAVEIQNAIGEMIQANGNKPIKVTNSQIWRAFACLDDGAWVSSKNQEYVGEIVDLLSNIKGRIDFTQQIEKHKGIKKDSGYDYKKTILEGPLVMADKITVKAGGHETKGYALYRLPIHFMHSHLTGQIIRIDKALLDTTSKKILDAQGNKRTAETRNKDISFILLMRHLARQVEHMKSDKNKAGKYEGRRSFKAIAEALADKPLTEKQMRTMRENIELLCTRWKIQGYIQGYDLYRARGSRAFTGVKIDL